MLLGTSPGVAADALLSRGGVNVAARPSPSAVSPPRRRGEPFPRLSRARPRPRRRGARSGARPARTRTARPRGGTAPSAARRRARHRAAPAVVGFDLDARSSEAASRSSVRQGSSVKVSALRLGSPGAEVASPADATARGDADSKHAARRSRADRPPARRLGARFVGDARRARDARAEAAAAPRVPDEAGRAIGLRRV